MSNRSRIVLGSLGGAFAIHLAALACSGNHSIVGSRDASMADAGAAQQHDGGFVDTITSMVDAVRDVATQVIDGEVRDAHAGGGTVVEVACDQESTTTMTQVTDAGVPYSSVTTGYWGVAPSAPVNPRMVPVITAYLCDPESFGTPAATCPGGFRCQTTGTPFPTRGDCALTFGALAPDGRVAVGCGSRTVTTTGGTMSATTTTGTRYRRAYVRID